MAEEEKFGNDNKQTHPFAYMHVWKYVVYMDTQQIQICFVSFSYHDAFYIFSVVKIYSNVVCFTRQRDAHIMIEN